MFLRRKVLLALLASVGRPLSPTEFVKLVFLLRHETELGGKAAFYDFVPYRFGPFSFTLYRELDGLRAERFVSSSTNRIRIAPGAEGLCKSAERTLPTWACSAVKHIVRAFGHMRRRELVDVVYRRYPWYAGRSESRRAEHAHCFRSLAPPAAVYTVGYEGKSVDAFFDALLKAGIEAILDVRAAPVSRKYGFSQKSLRAITAKLEMEYRHFPELGIPGSQRRGLASRRDYQVLLDRYQSETLPNRTQSVNQVADLLFRRPSTLMCVEADVECCHRSRLANTLALVTGLPVAHL